MNALVRPLVAVLLSALALPLLAQPEASRKPITAEQKAEVLADIESIVTKDAFVPGVDFGKWPDMIQDNLTAINEAGTEVEFAQRVNQALGKFGFSHIVLYSPAAATARTSRRMVGIGVRIQIEATGIRITGIFPNSPASDSGLAEGDLIIAADGKPVRTPADLAGEDGSKVKVTVMRDTQQREYEVTRRPFSTVVPEAIERLDGRTMKVTIPTFDIGYDAKRVDEIMGEALKAENLVVDLRGNGGGAVLNLRHFASYFLTDDQPLGTFVMRSTVRGFERATGEKATDVVKVAAWSKEKIRTSSSRPRFAGRVAVLVNGGTGSASEIFAAAAREHLGARLIGSKTAGAVLASFVRPIAHGFALQYPVTDYVSTKGIRVEGNGLSPDIMTTPSRFGEPDNALVQALKVFERG